MIVDFPHALANVLSTVEQGRLGYVLYRDLKSDRRIVVLVEGARDAAAFEAILRSAGGGEDDGAAKSKAGHNFVLRAASPDGASERDYFIEVKTSSEDTGIANLLWLAATDAGGAAARESIERDS